MSFKSQLIGRIGEELTREEIELVPAGFQKVGDKIIVNLPLELEDKYQVIGEGILLIFPSIKSVYVKVGEITGELRRPQIELIAGVDNSIVENLENGVWYCYDAKKIMFAKGNVSERGRLPKLVTEGEIIVDMFVGIGYFSLPIAKLAKPKKIYGIDKNKDSIYWLKKGIEKNKISNIEVIEGDSKKVVGELLSRGVIADRVLMGYLPEPVEFIPYALSILKKGGIVHYDALIRTDNVKEDLQRVKALFEESGRKAKIVNPQRVKSYRPKVDHYVVDLKIY
ncbi:class I SAM-dependent methyltransferase family protein [archaeon]|nr:class I SAM-dependent methyltransferase family protein [archaeon]